jgi:predicted GIY-YIG superfamily endonuclease
MAENVTARLLRPNSDGNKTTQPYRPYILIYEKAFSTSIAARAHEKWLKSTTGRRFLRNLPPP